MVDVARREDALLEKIHELAGERDEARRQLSVERAAHRHTKKELADAMELAVHV